MLGCLGIYVEDNLIKYAKVSKDRDILKVESYGVKFYDDLKKTISQIMLETYSYKTPISINISNEQYSYSNLFNLLNKKDLQKAINTEFDYFCTENGKIRNAIEYRQIESPNIEDKDKINVLYAYTDKSNILEKMQLLDGYKIANISPLAITISNLINSKVQDNTLIINIEKQTELTTLVNGIPYKVNIIEEGMQKILKNISIKENSQLKAYEICKNTTIYTSAGENLQQEDNEYLVDIVPVLYNIVQQIKDVITQNQIDIKNIYITGMGTVINNIDLYFQENFLDKKCEILTPYFIKKDNLKLNIKDYIEVNSAISIAAQGLDVGQKDISFSKKGQSWNRFKELLTSDVGKKNNNVEFKEKVRKSIKDNFKYDLNGKLDIIEKNLIRIIALLVTIIIIYIIFSKTLSNKIQKRTQEAEEVFNNNNERIAEIQSNIDLMKTRVDNYNTLKAQLEENSQKITNWYSRKNSIPNLLNKIMYIIPEQVQILSIENTGEKHIVIQAQSSEYQYLGYLKAKIQTEAILTNVVSNSTTRTSNYVNIDNYVNVVIEGDLPY